MAGRNETNLYWSNEYVLAANEFLHNKIGLIYSTLLVNKLFKEEANQITRKEFLKKTSNGTGKRAPCDWMFDTNVLRRLFRELFDQDLEVDTVC